MPIIFLLLFTLFFSTTTSSSLHHHQHYNRRRLLHQPFFPLVPTTPPPVLPPLQSPSPSPSLLPQAPHRQQVLPKYPFSTTPPNNHQMPFFPSYPSPPPPPSPPPSILSTLPANISSLLFPHQPSKSSHHHIIILAVSLSFLFAAILAAVAAVFIYFPSKHRSSPGKISTSDGQRLFPPNLPSSDGSHKTTNAQRNVSSSASNQPSTSSEYLYLGTLVNSRSGEMMVNTRNAAVKIGVTNSLSGYRKLGSPELKPLPPLPRHNPSYSSGEMYFSKEDDDKVKNEFRV